MSTNLSVLTHPLSSSNSPDFDICDRRYGTNLDIPRCDVAAARLDFGSSKITYHISDREGPHTLPQRTEYGERLDYLILPRKLTNLIRRLRHIRRGGRSGFTCNVHCRTGYYSISRQPSHK